MKSTLLPAVVAIGFSLVALLPSAQAETMQAVEGTNVVFYYDADFWGQSAGTVTGNSISFAPKSAYQLSATGVDAADSPYSGYTQHAANLLVAVAKSGYTLNSVVDFCLRGSASLATDGYAIAMLSGYIRNGIYDANGFWPNSPFQEFVSLPAFGLINGSLEGSGSTVGDGQNYRVLGMLGDVGLFVGHTGVGTSTASLSEVRYAFTVSAVPEPEVILMLTGGLALLALCTRRRKMV